MLSETFAESRRVQFAVSENQNGPAEILAGSGIMNYHLVEDTDD